MTSISITSPASIDEGMKGKRGLRREKNPIVGGALEIAKHPLRSKLMICSGTMHELSKFVDSIRHIRPSEGEVLKSPKNLSIFGGIMAGGPIIKPEGVRGRQGSDDFLSIMHVSVMKEVTNVFAL